MLIKRSISLSGHRTSLALEAEFWLEIERLAGEANLSLAGFIRQVDDRREPHSNLASQLRLLVLADLKKAKLDAGAPTT